MADDRALFEEDAHLAEMKVVLLQLCGELLLQTPPARPPTIVRSNATIGLELLDLLLNPDHVLRITEELTLRNTLTLERRVRLDISLDRLSRQQENGASQVSALVSGRVGLDEATPSGPERLWLPLDTVPRPISVAVTATGVEGTPLPRPPQPAVRRALAAALDHILLESLRAHPDLDIEEQAVHVLMHDNPARWLLQSALQSVAEFGAATHRAYERLQVLSTCGPDPDPTTVGSAADLGSFVEALTRAEQPSPAGKTALRVVQTVLMWDRPFLELLRLVHDHYFVVAGLDQRIRYHIVEYDLPESDAITESALRSPYQRLRGGFDPREHNYSAHIKVPLPDNVDEYNLYVNAASKGAAAPNEVSLIGVVHFGGHPVRSSLEALSTCADQLDATLVTINAGDHEDDSPSDDIVARKLAYIASQAAPALDRIDAVADQQNRAADELEARSGWASTRLVKQLFRGLRTVATTARGLIGQARDDLGALLDCLRQDDIRPVQVEQATAAMRDTIGAMEHPLLARRLVSSELTGREIGRIRLSRSRGTSPTGVRPRMLEVWATMTDEARPYALAAIGPPVGLAILVYLAGALLFDAATWPFHVARLTGEVTANREADAIVAVLLLIPGFALTQLKLPDRWSVSGRLHRPGHFFVMVAIVTLGATSIVVATQVGGLTAIHPHILLWTLRTALAVFVICSLWATLAAVLRKRYSWRPKGLRVLLGAQPTVSSGRQRSWPAPIGRLLSTLRSWSTHFWRYDSKPPDVDFDLTKPGESPWKGDR